MAADPYLAVTLDAKRRIAQVARALAQPHPGTAGSGLLELLEDVWRRKDPAVSADILAACFGPEPRIAGLLVTFGFLVVRGDGWELCAAEADRLLSTHRQRVAAGKARAAAAERSGGAFTSGPPAGHQRATSGPPAADQLLQPAASSQQRREDLPRAPPAADDVTDDPPLKTRRKKAPKDDTDPRHHPLKLALCATYLRLRGAAYPFDGGADAKRLRRLLARTEPAVLESAWERALQSSYPTVATLAELEKWLPHFIGAAPNAGRGVTGRVEGDLRKGTVRAEDQDHLHGPPGAHEF